MFWIPHNFETDRWKIGCTGSTVIDNNKEKRSVGGSIFSQKPLYSKIDKCFLN